MDINPETYLEDVIRKIDTTPASQIAKLTPWAWAEEHGLPPAELNRSVTRWQPARSRGRPDSYVPEVHKLMYFMQEAGEPLSLRLTTSTAEQYTQALFAERSVPRGLKIPDFEAWALAFGQSPLQQMDSPNAWHSHPEAQNATPLHCRSHALRDTPPMPTPTSQLLDIPDYESVWRVDCAGAVGFVALHAVLRGHAFGGIRIREYAAEQDALDDALALSRAMSRKVVLTGIDGGGGKSVMMAPGPGLDRSACVAALGAFIESLDGRYCCGPDLGFTAADDVALRSTTRHVAVAGMSASTADSVLASLLAACPAPRRVAIAGLGSVGLPLAGLLRARGVEVVAADVRPVEGFELVDPQAIHREECDVFAPCAAGAVLDAQTIPELRCAVVCGGANNPCATSEDIERLHQRGIIYVPDMLANCGAAIVGASETLGQAELIDERLAAVGPRVTEILAEAARRGLSPHHVAVEAADARIDQLRGAG